MLVTKVDAVRSGNLFTKKKKYTYPMYVTFSTTLWVLSTLSSALWVSVRGKLGVFLWGGAHVFFSPFKGGSRGVLSLSHRATIPTKEGGT